MSYFKNYKIKKKKLLRFFACWKGIAGVFQMCPNKPTNLHVTGGEGGWQDYGARTVFFHITQSHLSNIQCVGQYGTVTE